MRLIGDIRSELFHYEVRITYDTPEVAESRRIVREAQQTDGPTWQISEWQPGPGRKSGVVKQSKKASTSNRAFYLLIGALGVAGIVALTYQSTRPKGVGRASPVDTTLPQCSQRDT